MCIRDSNEGLLIIGATNMPWHIDPAFRRPGRFDRTIFVPPPDAEGRASILEILLKGKPVKDVAVRDIAKKTEHFSGADLKAVIDLAIDVYKRQGWCRWWCPTTSARRSWWCAPG